MQGDEGAAAKAYHAGQEQIQFSWNMKLILCRFILPDMKLIHIASRQRSFKTRRVHFEIVVLLFLAAAGVVVRVVVVVVEEEEVKVPLPPPPPLLFGWHRTAARQKLPAGCPRPRRVSLVVFACAP